MRIIVNMTIKGVGVSLSDIVEPLLARPHIAAPAVSGWWTWTHGGGPGSDAPLAAGVVGTLAPPVPENR